MIERPVQLVNRVRAKRVTHLLPVERHAHRGVGDMAVTGNVGEVGEAVHQTPRRRVKRIVAQSYRVRRRNAVLASSM